MVAIVLLLIIVWIGLGVVGAAVHGLIWLTIVAALLFVATLFFSGSLFGRRGIRR